MRLSSGKYFGETVKERRSDGLLLALSVYQPRGAQPWHCHENPTFFLLLDGEHRDQSRSGYFEQPAFSLVYHPTTNPHAGESGTLGMRGLNIEFEPAWLERHQLNEANLGGYRPLTSPLLRVRALQFVASAFHAGAAPAADLDTQALELLEPLVATTTGQDASAPSHRLKKAEEFLDSRFRDSISLRDAAAEAGVHPVHLARLFRQRHGCAVSEYLRALRLAEAARLVFGGASLAEASCGAGFADQPHFSRSFSAAFGCTPKQGLWPTRLALKR